MGKNSGIGQFEQLVLTAILTLGDQAYGIPIHGKARTLSKRASLTLGAVYVTLDRLEEKGLVSSWLSDPTPERGGRAKRYYRVEKAGTRALREAADTAHRIAEALESVWGRGGPHRRKA